VQIGVFYHYALPREKNVQQMSYLMAKRQAGLTLVELMITLGIVAILTLAVGPSVQNILIQNRIVGEINELSGLVQFARNNAIDEQVDTILCPSTDFATCSANWNDPKIVFADVDGNGARGADEELLVGSSGISANNILTGPAAAINFEASGAVSAAASLLLCHKDKDDEYARLLTVSPQGRVKMSQDTDNDGIHEDQDGVALDCGV
jgi:type IV fimbrial biogenesis protein FimT